MKNQTQAYSSRLRERSTLSPTDKDAAIFLSIAQQLEDNEKVVKSLKGKVELLEDKLKVTEDIISSKNKEIAALEDLRKTARLERDQLLIAFTRVPQLQQTFSLIELAAFCTKMHEWQEGPRTEILQDLTEEDSGRPVEKLLAV